MASHGGGSRAGRLADPAGSDGPGPDATVLPKRLGRVVATSFVVGYVVGLSAIALIFPSAPSLPFLIFLLAVGAVYTAMGSLIYAELSTRVPRAGGEYAYVERAFGPRWGFFRAWAAFAVVLPATLALLVQVDVQFLEAMFGAITPAGEKILAVLLLTLGLWVNLFDIRMSGRVITAWGAVKVGTIAAIVVGALLAISGGHVASDAWAAPQAAQSLGGFGSIGFVVTAVPFALLIYDGAYDVVALAEDMKEPRRTLPFALFAGLAISFVLFSVLGAALLVVQGYGVASGDVVAVFRGLGTAFGPGVERAFLFAYTLVGFGGTTAILLGASRYAFGAARDGHFLAIVGRLHPRRKTPTAALFLVYLLCVGYALAAGINGLISFYVSALAALSLLAIAALLRLRRMGVGAQDHFRAPGGTALPLAWGAVTLLVITASLWDSASQIGIAGAVGLFVLLGLAFPVLALTRRRPERGRSVSLPIQGSGGSPPPAPEMGAE